MGCGTDFHECKKEDHNLECPNAAVLCPYIAIGCTKQLLRKDFLSHIAIHQGQLIHDGYITIDILSFLLERRFL